MIRLEQVASAVDDDTDESPPPPAARTSRVDSLLSWGAAVANARGSVTIDPVDLVLGAMANARAHPGDHSAGALYEAVSDDPPRSGRLDSAMQAISITTTPTPVDDEPDATAERAEALLVASASIAAATTGGTTVHQRHLVAAAIAAGALPSPITDALGVTGTDLRESVRAYIGRKWPDEPEDVWTGVLAEPQLDLTHGFAGDQVRNWKWRHDHDEALTDHLNVQVYATMLATLIARRSTADALSIGLFGEWGAGKSTFMELVQQEIEHLTARTKNDPNSDYVTDIVPIWFNAWHYADANLWASLAAEMFDQLLGPRPDLGLERQDQLRTELETNQRRATDLRLASRAAEQRAGELRTALIEAERRRVAARGRLDAADLERIVHDETVAAQLRSAAKQANLDPKQLTIVAELAKDVAGTADDVAAIHKVLRRRSWTAVFVTSLVVLLSLAAAIAFDRVQRLLGGASIAGLAVILGQVGTAVKGARAALTPLRRAAEAADKIDRPTGEDRSDRETELIAELTVAEGKSAVLATQLDETLSNVAAIEGQLQDLTPGSRLYSFLTARAASTDYRSQLGVVSMIRRDFDQLAALMAEWRAAQTDGSESNESRRPIDRIVLYIDDLDRCEPNQVVAVLQAVNLLVAMDLFIVVVGVDPRWLLRSLRRRYRSLLGSDDDPSFRTSTPQDYLEKIFQVPFVLPAFGAEGLTQLLGSLADAGGRGDSGEPDGVGDIAPVVETRSEPLPAAETGTVPRGEAAALPAEQRSEVAAALQRTPTPATVSLDVTDAELVLLSRLHRFVTTPRSAKRLFNIYRLLRSTRDLRPAARFLGDAGQPGEYQAVAVLLGVLTAHPDLLGIMLWGRRADGRVETNALANRGSGGSWRIFTEGLRPRARTALTGQEPNAAADDPYRWENDVTDMIDERSRLEWDELVDGLGELLGPADSPQVALDDIDAYRLWAPRIARFSFVLSGFAGSFAGSEAA